MVALLKSLERRRLMITISTMLQFGLFLIALIGLVIKLIELSNKKSLTLAGFDNKFSIQCIIFIRVFAVEFWRGPLYHDNTYIPAIKIPINLWVNGKNKTISTDKIATNKKLVTAQIDVKLRRYPQEYNICGHNLTGKGYFFGYKS
uniref:Snterotoxin A n=8 Tax=root TaxID=1 RepID=A0A0U5AQ00_STAAU|nr:snterotoxin A [Staphylococcus aureus]